MWHSVGRLVWALFIELIGRKIGMVIGAVAVVLLAVLYLGAREYEAEAPRLAVTEAEIVKLEFICTLTAPPTANGRLDGIRFTGSCTDAELRRRADLGRNFRPMTRQTWVTLAFTTEAGKAVEARGLTDDLGIDGDSVNPGDQATIAYDRNRPTVIKRPPMVTAARWGIYAGAGSVLLILGALAYALDGFGGLDRMRRRTG